MRTELLINNQLQPGEGSAETILDAARGNAIAMVREASAAQLDAAVESAERAFEGWSQTPPKDRSAALLKLADRIEAEGPTLAQLESSNTGKPLNAVINDEIPTIADVFRYFAGAARAQHGLAAGEYAAGF